MSSLKTLDFYFAPARYTASRYTATISSTMDEDAIYDCFRAAIAALIDPPSTSSSQTRGVRRCACTTRACAQALCTTL